MLKSLSSREEDVLRRRYGLHGKPAETLEQIGEIYKVTRERIRQIESGAISKIKKFTQTANQVQHLADAIINVINNHGGIIKEENFLSQILDIKEDQQSAKSATLFVMRFILTDKLKNFVINENFHTAWQLKTAPIHLVTETITQAEEILQAESKPLKVSELIEKIRKTKFGEEHRFQLSDEAILSYIDISKQIAKNPYNEYGLVGWGSIIPKRMNDKIYLILKKANKPLHFNEITKLINQTKFDHRVAYPPTVHNELILNSRYVLVGRGIYALKEWGYKPGVVADILAEVLKKSGRSMKRDELVEEVLKQRMVKKNTIQLALTNHSKFTKLPSGEYILLEKANPN
ncbi:MAG: sigma factor-like helix-turn-helix DNA-binding protein [Patescibacteria group bacterium]